LLDPSKALNVTATHPTRPALPVAGTTYASGLGFTGALAVGVTPAVAAKNEVRTFDHEFTWGSAILGHAENDFRRPVIFNPTVLIPDAPTNLADTTGTAVLTWTDPTPAPTALAPNLATLANTKNELGFYVLKAAVDANNQPVLPGAKVIDPVTNLPVTIQANGTRWTELGAITLPFTPVAYAVTAYNVAGESSPSNWLVEAPPLAPTCPNPGASATAYITPATTTADVSVTLNCFDNANNEQTFNVSRSGGLGPVVNTPLPAITVPPVGGALTFTDTPVVENTTYTYSLTAKNVFGTSAAATVTVKTPISVPLAPTNLASTLIPSTAANCPTGIQAPCKPADVQLSWTDAAFNETGYTISRSGGTGSFGPTVVTGTAAADVLNATGSTLTYVDTTAAEGVPYTYTVTANNVDVNGKPQSSSATLTPVTLPVTAPTIPTGVTVVPSTAVDANGVYVDTALVSWTDNAFNETGYQVMRAVTAPANQVAPAILAGIVPANMTNNPMGTATAGWATPNPTMTFTDTNLADGVTYAYTVAAINSAAPAAVLPAVGGGVPSATVTKQMPGIIINAPSNFVATPNRAGSSIGLSWRDNARNETDYLVEERVSADNGTTWTKDWAVVNGTPILSPAVPNGVGTVTLNRGNVPTTLGLLYSFRVSARNVPSDSPYAYVQSNLLAPTAPAAPVVTGSFVQATRMVTVSWPAVTQPGTTISYIVNVNGVPVTTNNTTYTFRATVAQLTAATPVVVTVQTVARAIRVAGQTVFGSTTSVDSLPYSPIVTGPVAPITPTGLAATVSAAGAVTLNWTAVAPAAGTTITYLVSVDGGTPVVAARGVVLTATTTPAVALGTSHTVTVVARATTLGLYTDSLLPATTTVDLTPAVAPVAPATLTVSATALNWAAATVVPTNATVTYTVDK